MEETEKDKNENKSSKPAMLSFWLTKKYTNMEDIQSKLLFA